jgi:CRP/FNR family transcriptional regulator, cyclic AMP receptor protein
MMNEDTKLQALQASRLATDLDPEECRVLAALCTVHDLADGEILVRQGKADNHLHVVVNGVIGIVANADSDNRVTVATLGTGDLAGELGFVDGTERHASLIAIGAGRVLGLEREKLESLLTTQPTIVYHVMRAIIRTVHQTQRRLSLQAVELQNYIYKQHGRY